MSERTSKQERYSRLSGWCCAACPSADWWCMAAAASRIDMRMPNQHRLILRMLGMSCVSVLRSEWGSRTVEHFPSTESNYSLVLAWPPFGAQATLSSADEDGDRYGNNIHDGAAHTHHSFCPDGRWRNVCVAQMPALGQTQH